MFEFEKAILGPESIKGYDKNEAPNYIISKKQLKVVWKRMLDQLSQ
jgi:hypothetical protein